MADNFSIDESMLNVLEGLVEGRNEFFNSHSLRAFDWNSRANIASRFMTNELCILEVANRIYSNHIHMRNAAATLISFTMPLQVPRFSDPVVVTASNDQINGAMESLPADASPSNCAICQDSITTNGVRLVSCRHAYHRGCISNWFGMSVRCPVCRHDIREEDQANQTSSDASQTSSQLPNQLGEH